MTGCGLFPYGFGSAGNGAIPSAVADVISSAADGVAFIDQNGDMQPNGTGDVVKTTPTKQRVLLLLRTELNSVVGESDLGIKREEAIDSSWEYRMRRSVENALAPAILDGTISVISITIARVSAGRASIGVAYFDEEHGTREEVSI